METRYIARLALIAGAAMTLGSVPAMAQIVAFATPASFSGGSCGPVSCSFGGFVLIHTGPSAGDDDVDLWHLPPGLERERDRHRHEHSSRAHKHDKDHLGADASTGTIVGSLGSNPPGSGLFLAPNQSSVVIGGVVNALIETNQGGSNVTTNIVAQSVNSGSTTTNVTALVSAVPEPATLWLMATGLLGFIPVMRRRRSA